VIKRDHDHSVPTFTTALYSLGRAGFGSLVSSGKNLQDFLLLLQAKLCGGVPSEVLLDSPTLNRLEGSLAVLACMTALDITPTCRIATSMVASRMATCLAVSTDRQTMLAAYVSEPALSIAARSLFFVPDFQRNILSDLIKAVGHGFVTPSAVGESICELVIQQAVGRASQPDEVMKPLSSVLEQLLEPDVLPSVMKAMTIQNYVPYVGLTLFIPCSYDPSLEQLADFVDRSAGIRCKDYQPGMDIVIPIVYVKQDQSERGAEHIMSYWSIQVKNRIADTMSDEDVRTRLSHSSCFRKGSPSLVVPYLTMHISLRELQDPFQRFIEPQGGSDDKLQVCIRCQGLENMPMFQSEQGGEVVDWLQRVLETRNDAQAMVASEFKEIAFEMTPLTSVRPVSKTVCRATTTKGQPCTRPVTITGCKSGRHCWQHGKQVCGPGKCQIPDP
jgi:hypothetical protein